MVERAIIPEAIITSTIEIPFLLTPLKGKIEETLKKNLSKVLS